ncbi:hypothetical protein MATL_G00263330 [Megalops atlanticus]|uniref:G-protein coupled receptors family 1 profile domain-containing protein n=1 Tax=Megalops atlanticus TaxID=7932 RepID=A0A9D3PBK3_MEGAT|nr:hypothetical protein MATL_G00263330 [Megalops atlanticus]
MKHSSFPIHSSLVGSSSVVVVSIVKRRYLNEQAQLLFQLALADFLAAAVLLCVSAMNLTDPQQHTDRFKLCSYGLPLTLAFYCVSFLLVAVYAYRLKQAVAGWRESSDSADAGQRNSRNSRAFSWLCVSVWSLPIACYVCYVSVSSSPANETMRVELYSRKGCGTDTQLQSRKLSSSTLDHRPSLTWEQNWFELELRFRMKLRPADTWPKQVIYCQVGRWHRKYAQRRLLLVEGDGFGRRRLRGLGSTPLSMVLVPIVCWTPACLLVGLSYVGQISQDRLFVLYVIQALMVSLQGLLHSAVYGWLRRNFREAALSERLPLLAESPRPFYDESLPRPP